MALTLFTEAMVVSAIILIIWLTLFLVSHYKKHQANKELWATIFEGMTNKLADLTPLKTPDTYVQKKAQRNGQGKDSDADDKQ